MATQTALDLLLNMSAQRELGGTALQVSRQGLLPGLVTLCVRLCWVQGLEEGRESNLPHPQEALVGRGTNALQPGGALRRGLTARPGRARRARQVRNLHFSLQLSASSIVHAAAPAFKPHSVIFLLLCGRPAPVPVPP